MSAVREPVVVAPTDRLHVPHRKRLRHAYVTTETGARELYLYYGVKEVSFDEERLFPFGETLVHQTSFVAEIATTWGPGYDWEEVRSMFEALVAEGIIQRGETVEDPRGGGLVPSLLPPSKCPVARSWSAPDCEPITRELGGRAVEIGNIETFVSVYRIAHPALDGDDRQVGEANVFPPGLRLDRETEWRVCQYPGSRYRDGAPMNVTALKAMIKHWKPMMATLLEARAQFRDRLGLGHDGWTVGDLHLFSCVVLSLPAFQLMRGPTSGHAPIHPVLSSLFRITDGIRMTTHLMLFLSDERTRSPHEPTTAAELYDFAERNGLFLSGHGVCAGPRPMIDEFLNIVFSGQPGPGMDGVELAPEVRGLLSELPAASEYAFLGLQSWAVSRSIWLAISRAYRAIRKLLEGVGERDGLIERLQARMDVDWAKLNVQRIAVEYDHDVHVTVYKDTYEQSWRGLTSPQGAPTIEERVAPAPEGPLHVAAGRTLRELLGVRLAGTPLGRPAELDRLVSILVECLREEQGVLASVAELQAEINTRLGRPHPSRPLTIRDMQVQFKMHGGRVGEFSYVFDALEDELGIHVECTASSIEVKGHRGGQLPADSKAYTDAVVGAQ